MTLVKFYLINNGKKALKAEREISQEEQDEIINNLNENYRQMRVDDLK